MKALRLAIAAALALFVILGGVLQTCTLSHAQKLAKAMHAQMVYIQASKVVQHLGEAESSMVRYSMTRKPEFAEKFNAANELLPKAVDDLGNLGPFDGSEAEAVSQLKQNTSDCMGLLGKAREAATSNTSEPRQRFRSFSTFKDMNQYGEKIQGCLLRLTPAAGTSGFLEQQKDMQREATLLRTITVIWLVVSLLLTAGLIVVTRIGPSRTSSA